MLSRVVLDSSMRTLSRLQVAYGIIMAIGVKICEPNVKSWSIRKMEPCKVMSIKRSTLPEHLRLHVSALVCTWHGSGKLARHSANPEPWSRGLNFDLGSKIHKECSPNLYLFIFFL